MKHAQTESRRGYFKQGEVRKRATSLFRRRIVQGLRRTADETGKKAPATSSSRPFFFSISRSKSAGRSRSGGLRAASTLLAKLQNPQERERAAVEELPARSERAAREISARPSPEASSLRRPAARLSRTERTAFPSISASSSSSLLFFYPLFLATLFFVSVGERLSSRLRARPFLLFVPACCRPLSSRPSGEERRESLNVFPVSDA